MANCPGHPWTALDGCRWCRAGISDNTRVRLVVRVSEMLGGPPAGAVVESCAVCWRPVYVDRAGAPDPPGKVLTLVCVECAMEDPDGRRQVRNMMAAMARLGTVLPPASRPGNAFARKRKD